MFTVAPGSSSLQLDATELATVAFLTAIAQMQEGTAAVDVDRIIRLADFVFDAHELACNHRSSLPATT